MPTDSHDTGFTIGEPMTLSVPPPRSKYQPIWDAAQALPIGAMLPVTFPETALAANFVSSYRNMMAKRGLRAVRRGPTAYIVREARDE